MPVEKLDAIRDVEFGGLLQLACKKLRYELCQYIIAHYDVAYHRIKIEGDRILPITINDVRDVMGIPCDAVDVIMYPRHGSITHTYSIHQLEEKLIELPIGEEFLKLFIIFSCATILAPNSKLEGIHDLWDFAMDNDIIRHHNWGKFMLKYLEDGMRDFQNGNGMYMRRCLLFLQVPSNICC